VKWRFSTDDSVDLAVTPITLSESLYDYATIQTTLFTTNEQILEKVVVEGDPVLFSGLFIQSFRELHTLEPIVRSGTLAMIPNGLQKTTMNERPGHIYLAEAHVFGGNSGSPMFVDVNKFTTHGGFDYKFLGVIAGEVFENSDLTFSVTTSIAANVHANSDVSMIVPANEVLKILNLPELQSERDAYVARQPVPKATSPSDTPTVPK
jgi:hypothetical protein